MQKADNSPNPDLQTELKVTFHLPIGKWFDTIGDSTIADAILDRRVHTAHRIELKGDSLRKKYSFG